MHRNLLGYIEVATLKKKWEAGEVNPVSILPSHIVLLECGLEQEALIHRQIRSRPV